MYKLLTGYWEVRIIMRLKVDSLLSIYLYIVLIVTMSMYFFF